MKKLDFPDEYHVYHNNQEELFVLDKANMEAITKESFLYQSYMKIPDDKEVECFVVEYDQVTNTYKPNFEKKVRVKMKLLEAHIYERSLITPKEKTGKKESPPRKVGGKGCQCSR